MVEKKMILSNFLAFVYEKLCRLKGKEMKMIRSFKLYRVEAQESSVQT